jgi:hypothetical protein
MGDVDLSGKVDMNDAVQVLMYLAKLPCIINDDDMGNESFHIARINGKDKPILDDGVQIIMAVAKLSSKIIAL